MSQTKNDLLTGPVRPALLRYALPILLSMVATQAYTVADTMIVGLRLDAAALAAVSNASTVLMIFLFISGGMELGGGLLLAANRPTATKEELSRLTYNLLFLDGAVSLLMLGLGLPFAEVLLRWINTPAEILPQAAVYARVYLLGLPCLMLYDLSKQIAIGCGDSKTPLYAVLATSVLNIVLDLLMVGPYGVAGTAAATALSQLAGCVFMLGYLGRTLLCERFSPAMLRRKYVWDILRLSAPNALQQAVAPVTGLVRQSLLGALGVSAIAGFSCANKLTTLLLMPVYGFAQALVFFIAQNTSAGQPQRVQEGLRQTRRMMLGYNVLVLAVCILLARPLLGLFTRDAGALAYGALMLSREALSYPFTSMRHAEEAQLRGRQQMGLYLFSNLSQVAASLGFSLLLVPRIGFDGFYAASWISAPLGLALAVFLARRAKSQLPSQDAA